MVRARKRRPAADRPRRGSRRARRRRRVPGRVNVMDRREFLQLGAMAGAAGLLASCSSGTSRARRLPGSTTTTSVPRLESVLESAPGDSGIDTVVVAMMENRSFDSYLGWLARDETYLEQGRSHYGAKFAIDGSS